MTEWLTAGIGIFILAIPAWVIAVLLRGRSRAVAEIAARSGLHRRGNRRLIGELLDLPLVVEREREGVCYRFDVSAWAPGVDDDAVETMIDAIRLRAESGLSRSGGWSVHGGLVSWQTATRDWNPEEVLDALDELERIAHALELGLLSRSELAAAVRGSRDPHRRLRNLRDLCHSEPPDDELTLLAVELLDDEDAAVRLEAALLLGDVGRSNLAEIADDRSAPDDVRLVAGKSLGGEGAFALWDLARARGPWSHDAGQAFAARADDAQLAEAVKVAIREQHTFAPAVIDAVGRRGGVRALAALNDAAFLSRNPRLRAAVARALGRSGDRAYEETLIRLLDDVRDGVAVAASSALERVGSARAAHALAVRARAVGTSPGVREILTEARRTVEAREGRGTPGQLSVVTVSGELSIPELTGELSEARAASVNER